jgi:hypothetical protein
MLYEKKMEKNDFLVHLTEDLEIAKNFKPKNNKVLLNSKPWSIGPDHIRD